jgi:transcriptional regulator with XRE-family HTH domain
LLGSNIRLVRLSKKLTISEVARSADITRSLLSQIENKKANPSIKTLMAIAKTLQVPIGSFFDDNNHLNSPVVRAGERKALKTRSGITYFLLTPEPSKHSIEFLYNIFEKGSSTEIFYSHKGEECGIVLEGRLKINTDTDEYVLEAGDSIVLLSTKPHKLTNVGNGQTIAIWANSPPSW